ncbi:FkbM family methyltransferase [Patescibacteria group bacterium]|nr:FkbM family methyltransferase [Patescibacteria group bacterium]
MALNLSGKYRYISHLLSYYPDGLAILIKQRLLCKPITQLRLKNGLVIRGNRKSLLLDVVDEIFFRKGYTPKFLPIESGDVVVDIGANVGVFSLFAASKDAGKIYAFEPLPENAGLIYRNFKENNLPEPVVVQAAVADKTGLARFYLGKSDPHGSLLKEGFRKNIEVPTLTLRSIISKYHLKKVDFLKIDAEGSEGKIILSTPAYVWKKIRKVSLEYHDDMSPVKHEDLNKRFQRLGFKTRLTSDGSPYGYIYAWRE